MKFALAASLLFSMSVFANDSFDCRSGQSPQGGKFCYYVLSQCENEFALVAGQCAIEKYSSNVTWDGVTKVKPLFISEGNEKEFQITYSVKNKHGVQKQVVTLEVTEKGYNPVAIEIK